MLRRNGHDDLGRAEDPVAGLVARAQDLADRVGLDVGPGCWMRASWIVGSNSTPVSSMRTRPYVFSAFSSLAAIAANGSVREVAVLPGGVDVVQDRKQGVQDADDGHLPCHGAVTFDALAVVDVLGLQAAEVVLQFLRFPGA